MKQFECMFDQARLRSTNNIMKTEGLFIEYASKINSTAHRYNAEPVYTLRDSDRTDYPSMYLIYMDSATEYEAAIRLLGSWRHWKKLCQSPIFTPYLEEWQEERKIREN